MRKSQEPQELFIDNINTLINNFFIDNINWRSGYYYKMSMSEIKDVIKGQAKYLLEFIDNTRHLVGDEREVIEIKNRDTRETKWRS